MYSELPASIPDHVINDIFDNDVVVVNLISGSYYSLTGVAALLWSGLVNGSNRQTLLSILDNSSSEEDIDTFLRILSAEGLISAQENLDIALDEEEFRKSLETTIFESLIEKHTDVEELLLIDPIHEVDSSGWPNPA